jgi:hypothetical protein
MSRDEGNVPPKEEPRKDEEICIGDVVSMTPEAFKHAPRLMGPLKLYSVGWPNCFQVVHVFEHEGVPTLTLGECCFNLILNRKTGAHLCSGHKAKWFRKVGGGAEAEKEAPRERKKGDRLTSIDVPVVGEVGALEFHDDEHNPSIILRALKQRVVLNGPLAAEIAKLAQANGLL